MRIISLHSVKENTTISLRAYLHLLKNNLNDKWIIHNQPYQTEVLVLSYESRKSIIIDDKVKAIIYISYDRHTIPKLNCELNCYKVSLPISGSELVTVLNSISKELNKNEVKLENSNRKFSIKQILTKFIFNRSKSTINKKSNSQENIKPTPITNKLKTLSNLDNDRVLKVVFLGSPGSGKTTAIMSAQTKNLVTCEVNATDSVGLLKEQTTIGIDYCQCNITNGIRLNIFGTPGQGRYNYLQMQTVERADIFIILIDLSSLAPFTEFLYYDDIVNSSNPNINAIKLIAFTHYDLNVNNISTLSNEINKVCLGKVITTTLDPRNRNGVLAILQKVSSLIVNNIPIDKIYIENSTKFNI